MSKHQNIHLKVNDLSVIYPNGHRAINQINFELHSGTICALLGMNGSGKSTLFNAMMGVVKSQTGTVKINDFSLPEALQRKLIAYVPQNDQVDWHFPILVEDVVMLGRYGHMNFLRQAKAYDREKVEEALLRLGIADLRRRQIGELSGGQRKRVFLARALAQESPLILLDEPFTGVDIQTEETVMELLKALRTDGYLLLVSTHHLETVPLFCNEIMLLNRTILAHGSVSDIFTPAHLESAFGRSFRGQI